MPKDVPGCAFASNDPAQATSRSPTQTNPSIPKPPPRSSAQPKPNYMPPPRNSTSSSSSSSDEYDSPPTSRTTDTPQSPPSPPPFVDHLRIIPADDSYTLEWTFTPAAAVFVWPYAPDIDAPPCTCGQRACRGGVFVPEAWRVRRPGELVGFTVLEG